jgi:hypothetical protein
MVFDAINDSHVSKQIIFSKNHLIKNELEKDRRRDKIFINKILPQDILEQSLNKNMKRSNSQQDIQKDKTLNDILTEIFKDLQH